LLKERLGVNLFIGSGNVDPVWLLVVVT